MCGITGIVGSPSSRDAIERMTRRLVHRGPDDLGVWCTPEAHLGHTRLAILDLSSAGHQPMTLGALTVTYNGEIYNYPELRRRLPGPFRSECDTEVILHLFRRDREQCVHQLRGMFAFAVWDAERKTLFAARDRLGIKPFYYRELPGGIAFASELKALLELGRPPVDRSSLRDYFTYKFAPAPKTIYAGIRQLPPAHTLVWNGELRVERYWQPPLEIGIRDPQEAVERLGSLLPVVVDEHMLADVPVGVFLSGGIDSSTLVAHLERPRTFTLGCDIKRRDESGMARTIARHFGADHTEEIASAIDLDEALDTIPRVFDEPFGDSGAWSVYLVSELARRHVKVVLSGEGGDELFCGYDTYSKWFTDRSTLALRLLARWLPPFFRGARSCERRTAQGLERYASFIGPFTLRQKRALLAPDLLAEERDYDDLWHFRRYWREELEPIKRLQWVDLHVELAGGLLVKVDRASMAHSLEVRPPLLDHRLVELAMTLDGRLLRDIEGGRGKLVVRRLMEPRMPPGLFDRAKRGFNLPIRHWVSRHPGMLRSALDRLHQAGIVRRLGEPRFSNEQSWALLVLDRWITQTGAV